MNIKNIKNYFEDKKIPEYIQKNKKVIIPVAIAVVVVMILSIFLFPTPRSYITGVPVHFEGINTESTRDDLIKLYGKPIAKTETGLELFEAEFLNVKGHITVQYVEDSDRVYTIQFSIRSSDFGSIAKYQSAVDKTYDYFNLVLWRYYNEKGGDGGKLWLNESDHAGYLIYESNVYFDEDGPHSTLTELITVFQYYSLAEEIK